MAQLSRASSALVRFTLLSRFLFFSRFEELLALQRRDCLGLPLSMHRLWPPRKVAGDRVDDLLATVPVAEQREAL